MVDHCRVCKKIVHKEGLQCDQCDQWVHAKCNKINKQTYLKLESSFLPWYCIECHKETTTALPFCNLSDSHIMPMFSTKNNTRPILSECPTHLKSLFKNLNELSSTAIDCKYYDVDDLNSLNTKSDLSHFLHLNISSLPFHIDELKLLISSMDNMLEVIGIIESRLKKGKQSITDINIDNYFIEHTPTEAINGGALLYINSNCSYKTRQLHE